MSSKQEGGKDRTNLTIGLIMAAVLGIGFIIVFNVDSQRGPSTIPDEPEPLLVRPDATFVQELYSKGVRYIDIQNDAGQIRQRWVLSENGDCKTCRKISPEDGKEGHLDFKVDKLLDVFLNSAMAHGTCGPHCDCGYGPLSHKCENAGGWCCKCN